MQSINATFQVLLQQSATENKLMKEMNCDPMMMMMFKLKKYLIKCPFEIS